MMHETHDGPEGSRRDQDAASSADKPVLAAIQPVSRGQVPPWAAGGVPRSDPRRELVEFWRVLFAITPRVYVTYILMALNVAVLAWMAARGVSLWQPQAADLLDYGANFSPWTAAGEWWRLGTSMFLHVGLLHLLVNMWALWNLGPVLERFVGNVGFALVYALSGLAGGLASMVFSPGMVSAGASGAIFGLLGAIVGFVLLRRDSVPGRIFWGLLFNGVLCIAINVAIGLSLPFIDNAAHFGGLGAGFLCGLVLSRRLDPSAARGRWRRNLLLAVAGGTAVTAAAAALAEPELLDVILDIRDRAQRPVERYRQGELEPAELVRQLETGILPEWRSARRRVSARMQAGELAADELRTLAALAMAMQFYEDGWERLADGLRRNDHGAIDRAFRTLARGDEMLKADR